jgi:ribosomal protein S4
MGTGCVGSGGVCTGNVTVNENVVTIPLTNIDNDQEIDVTLFGVNNSDHTTIPMIVVAGDVNSNQLVNAADVAQTKSRLGQTVDATNFRSDLNTNGAISAGDISIVKRYLGTGWPPPP